MRSGSTRLLLFLAVLIFFVGIPVAKSFLQEMSIGQDLRRIQNEYSLHGAETFRKRVDEIVVRAPLDPAEVEIRIQEQRPRARVRVEIRYVSRMSLLFFIPVERRVVVREEIPLVDL